MSARTISVYLLILNAAMIARPQQPPGLTVSIGFCSEKKRLDEGRLAIGSEELAAVLAHYSQLISDHAIDRSEQECAGLVFSTQAVVLAVKGRIADAALNAEKSLAILEMIYPRDHPILLRSLNTLALAYFELGETGKAWRAYRRLQLIRTERPEDRAMVRGMTGTLLHSQRKFRDAASEFGKALRDLADAGRGNSADFGAMMIAHARVLIDDGQFEPALQELNRAGAIFAEAPDVVARDQIMLQQTRGHLYARRREWSKAEQDLRESLSRGDKEGVQSVITEKALLEYGMVLRKLHRSEEARSIRARASSLRGPTTTAVVDVAELSVHSAARNKN